MAASIRFRVIRVFLDDFSQEKLIAPFWIRILVEKDPFIHDVQSKIIELCRNILHSKLENDFLNGPHFIKEDAIHLRNKLFETNDEGKIIDPICSLWLDDSLLPPTESTEILQDNDAVVLKLISKIPVKGVNELTTVIHPVINDPKRSCASHTTKIDCQDANISFRNEEANKDSHSSALSKHSLSHKKKKSKRKNSEGDKSMMLNDLGDNAVSIPQERKKRKKDRESQNEHKRKKVDFCDEFLEKSSPSVENVTVILDESMEDVSNSAQSNQIDSLEIEEMKKRLLNDLSRFVETADLVNEKNKSAEDLNDSFTALPGTALDNSTEVKKRRRRRKKKSKQNEKVNEPMRIEDKPRISHLNLAWDKQPQNSKITFESDEDESMEKSGNDDSVGLNENGENCGVDDTLTKTSSPDNMTTAVEHKDLINEVEEKNSKHGLQHTDSKSETSLNMKNKRMESNYSAKVETNQKRHFPSRRLMLRSTGGILNSLRGDSVPTQEYKVPKANPMIPKTSTPQLLSPKKDTRITHTISPIDKPKSPATSNLMPNMHCDSDAKFNELLQRRKLSNTSCVVSTTQNGITVCSRNRNNRKVNGSRKDYVDPATDVLTNVSTVVKFEDRVNGEHFVKKDDLECGKVEVIPLDVGGCPVLQENPCIGDIIGYKVLEMNEDYNPVVSEFKTAKVCSFKDGVVYLQIFGSTAPKKQPGKFDLVYDDVPLEKENGDFVSMELVTMMDIRLIQRETV